MLEKFLSIILNEELVESIFFILAIAGPFVGLISGMVLGRIRGKSREYYWKGLFFGLLGPLNLLLYNLFEYMVRYDPKTGYVGLHHVKTLLINVLIFMSVGLVLGILYRLIFLKKQKEPD